MSAENPPPGPQQKVHLVPLATTFIIEHTIPVDSRADFLALDKSLDEAVRKAPGFVSVELEEMPSARPGEINYRTTLTFESQDALVAWIDSDLRHDLITNARKTFQYGYALKSTVRSFDAWFPSPDTPADDRPETWKMNVLVLLTLYPTVLALGPLLRPLTKNQDFATAMLLGNMCSVAITGWFLIPIANKWYGTWLQPRCPVRTQILGSLSIVVILFLVWFFNRG